MSLPNFTLKQLLVSVTWICVGFGLIAFSLREWDLPLSRSDDLLANLEPMVLLCTRLFGGVAVNWGIVILLTPKPTADILTAVVIGVIPGLIFGWLMCQVFFSPNSDAQGLGDWIGMGFPGVVLICLALFQNVPRGPQSP